MPPVCSHTQPTLCVLCVLYQSSRRLPVASIIATPATHLRPSLIGCGTTHCGSRSCVWQGWTFGGWCSSPRVPQINIGCAACFEQVKATGSLTKSGVETKTTSQNTEMAPQFGATFVPGGFDDYYMPEVVAPSPQRYVEEPTSHVRS